MQTDRLFKWTKYLSLFGILLALYLLFEYFTRSPFNPCNINSVINCNALISGEVSKTFGIPTALIGLTGYICILLASVFKKKKTILGFATFGLGFCLWIAYQEIFLLHVVCPVCILCQLTMISVFTLGIILNFRKTA